MKILFDYNRTLFNPDTNTLYEGVLPLLASLSQKHTLYLVSKYEKNRKNKIEELGIASYFTETHFVEEKTKELFINIAGSDTQMIVVGDRIKGEIKIANELGYITIWVKQGKFALETPETKNETPDETIKHIQELENKIQQYEK